MSGPEAAEAAGITYRQLDHWARKGWVAPSVQKAAGKASRRVYSSTDVLRLRVLRHFAQAGCALAELADEITGLPLAGEFLAVSPEGMTELADVDALVAAVIEPRMVAVFPLGRERRRLAATPADDAAVPERRLA